MKKLKFKKEVERLIIAFTVVSFIIVIIPGSVAVSAIAGICYYINLILLYKFGHLKNIIRNILKN